MKRVKSKRRLNLSPVCQSNKEILLIKSNEEEYDRRDYSITVRIPALSMIVLSYRPFTEKELEAIRIKKRKEMEKYVDAKTKEIIKERDEIIGKATEEANKKINELKKLLKGL